MSSPRARRDAPATTSLAGRIKRFRLAVGMPQEELAERLGTNKGTVSRWERGKQVPENLDALALQLGVTVADLTLKSAAPARTPLRVGERRTTYHPSRGDAPVTPMDQTPPPQAEAVRMLAQEIGAVLADVLHADELHGRDQAAQIAEDIGRLLGERHDSPRAWRLYELAARIRKGDL